MQCCSWRITNSCLNLCREEKLKWTNWSVVSLIPRTPHDIDFSPNSKKEKLQTLLNLLTAVLRSVSLGKAFDAAFTHGLAPKPDQMAR
jgi:hypothetical protein